MKTTIHRIKIRFEERYLGIWKAISSRESLGCNGARSKSLLGPLCTLLQQCMDPAVGWDWSVLVPRCPLWLGFPFCRFFRTSSAWRRRLCNRKKYIDISVPERTSTHGQRADSREGGRNVHPLFFFFFFVRTNIFFFFFFFLFKHGKFKFLYCEWIFISNIWSEKVRFWKKKFFKYLIWKFLLFLDDNFYYFFKWKLDLEEFWCKSYFEGYDINFWSFLYHCNFLPFNVILSKLKTEK